MSLDDAPSLAATAFNSSAEYGKGANASASFARLTEAPCQYSEYASVLAAILTVRRFWTAAAFEPLSFAPGDAYQFDWSHEVVLLSGVTVTG